MRLPFQTSLICLFLAMALTAEAAPKKLECWANVRVSGNGRIILLSTTDRRFLVRDRHNPTKRVFITPFNPSLPRGLIESESLCADGSLMAGREQGEIVIWNTKDGKPLAHYKAPTYWDIEISPDGNAVALCSDKQSAVWFWRTGEFRTTSSQEVLHFPRWVGSEIYFVAPKGQDGYLVICDGATFKEKLRVHMEKQPVPGAYPTGYGLIYPSPSGKYVVDAGYRDGVAVVEALTGHATQFINKFEANWYWDGEKLIIPWKEGMAQLDPAKDSLTHYKGRLRNGFRMAHYQGKDVFYESMTGIMVGSWPDLKSYTLPIEHPPGP